MMTKRRVKNSEGKYIVVYYMDEEEKGMGDGEK